MTSSYFVNKLDSLAIINFSNTTVFMMLCIKTYGLLLYSHFRESLVANNTLNNSINASGCEHK